MIEEELYSSQQEQLAQCQRHLKHAEHLRQALQEFDYQLAREIPTIRDIEGKTVKEARDHIRSLLTPDQLAAREAIKSELIVHFLRAAGLAEHYHLSFSDIITKPSNTRAT